MTLRRCAPTALVAALMLACAPPGPRRIEIPMFSDSFAYLVSWAPQPAVAREPVLFRVVVRDKKTKAPIENGEGRIFATSADGISTHDSFVAAQEVGTYTARLKFITAGDWAVGVQFRKDSTSRLERPEDLRLSVHNERQ